MRARFSNPYTRGAKRGFFHFLLWQAGYYNEKLSPIPDDFVFPNTCEKIDTSKPKVTWISHSTFFIEAFNHTILVDPVWSYRCSPISFIGPRCRMPILKRWDELGPISCVLISHNHYDHLDKRTVLKLFKRDPNIMWIVPKGIKKWFAHLLPYSHWKMIVELAWWEHFTYKTLTFTSVPAQHFSGRGLFDRNKTLWMGYVIECDMRKKVYFAGDTGYNEFDFKEIGRRFGAMDLSILPIGVYAPRQFMKPIHVNPEESILIHEEVGSRLSIGGHWGTFRLSAEELQRPPYDLYCSLEKKKISTKVFRVLQPGQTINW
jgi:N-acyl-phosphatidylethanolamine-hydrolysing phospholipase D